MTHGSLFSGIGGFDLAAEWMGWENVFHCEIEPFCQTNLKYHFSNSVLHENIKETDFTQYRGAINVLSGGFPCQPYSVAGKRKGKEDERHLWPEMLRAIREIQPTWVVGENVSGLVNWNGGLVFDEVQTDLETEGYEVIPFILPAAGVNAPHKRDRVWFVAYASKFRDTPFGKDSKIKGIRSHENVIPKIGIESAKRIDGFSGLLRDATDTKSKRLQGCNIIKKSIRFEPGNWNNWPKTKPVICSGDDGIPNRLDGITFSKWRNESIKAYGNAVVPQVVFQIFKAIEKFNKESWKI
jgi:DNA (cytosine-5)-methyltransferase 1